MDARKGHARGHWPALIVTAGGGLSALLGLAVLVGWYTHTTTLVQVWPTFAPMQPNTALGFLLSGVGLLSMAAGRRRLSVACGGIITAVGVLTLAQYLFGVNLGLDQVLIRAPIIVATSHPGRMAPNSALGFVLTGAALLLLGRLAHQRARVLPVDHRIYEEHSAQDFSLVTLGGLLGAFVAAFGTVAFVGYLSGVHAAYGWGQLTRMAVHTALGFTVLGISIVAVAWSEDQGRAAKAPHWLPFLVGISVATTTLLLWQALGVQQQAEVRRKVQMMAKDATNGVTVHLESRMLALVRMAKRWEHSGQPIKEAWEADASLYVSHNPGYQAIEWVDPSFHVHWVAPLMGNEAAQDLDLAREERWRSVLETARDRRGVVVSRTVELVQGGKGFLVAVPIFVGDEFAGCIVGVFRLHALLDAIWGPSLLPEYAVAAFDGVEEVYRRAPAGGQYEREWSDEVRSSFQGITWRLRIWPRPEMLAAVHSAIPEVTLVVGLLLAGLGAMVVQLAQTARRRWWKTEAANQVLQVEIGERKRAEEALRASQERFQSFMDHSPAVAFIKDGDGRYLYVNQTAQRVFHMPLADWLGKTDFDIWPAETAKQLRENDRAVLAEDKPVELLETAWQEDGIHHWLSVKIPITDPSGVRVLGGISLDITERERLAEALRQSKERFELAVQGSNDGVWDWNIETNETYFSPCWKSMLGFADHELPNHFNEWEKRLYPEDYDWVRTTLKAYLDGLTPLYELEHRLRHKDGTYRWILARGVCLRDASGKPYRMAGSHTDITSRKQAEDALRESEERFRRAFDDAAIGMALVAPDGHFLRVNRSLCAIVGYDEHELLATTFHAITHPDDLEADLAYVRQMLAGERDIYLMEKRYVHKRGSVVWALLSVSLVRDARGEPLHFVSQVQDITSHKRAEEALQESEDRYAGIFRHTSDAIFLVGVRPDDTFLYEGFNPAQEAASGLSSLDTCGKTPAECLSADVAAQVTARYHACVEAGHPISYEEEIELPSGKRSAQTLLVPIRDTAGRIYCLAGIVRDFTERKRMEEALARQAQELARSNVDLQQFASVASHDLQEPLRKIQTFADLLHTECRDALDEQGRDYLARIQNAAGRMQTLIKDLLELSRVTTRGQPFMPVDLTQVVREVAADLEARIAQTGGRVEVGVLPVIEADPTQMRQLLQNLIGNALKFHRRGEAPCVKVRGQGFNGQDLGPTGYSPAGHWCQILVEDNGIGFDQQYLERIFQPFQRLHGRQEYEGTGMGLAICRKIVERHGGTLTATSTPGQGATFIVTLPLKRAFPKGVQHEGTEGAGKTHYDPHRRGR